MNWTIVDLNPADAAQVPAAARLLVAAFAHLPDTWDTEAEALEEVHAALEPDKICRVALAADGALLGWIGGFHAYAQVWELHPLAVHPRQQGQGIGAALVRDLEAQVRARGGLVITLGTDDVIGQTSLAGVDLYPDVWPHIAALRNVGRHPYEFYQKLGYAITGVIPDANGFGRPDILMTRRLT
ncbi:MAG: GNAT family N-acetyltransferase [Anaerolineae bacterium]|nr:GNAT family N-acetyltransferase [Anaerolineae bacterium]